MKLAVGTVVTCHTFIVTSHTHGTIPSLFQFLVSRHTLLPCNSNSKISIALYLQMVPPGHGHGLEREVFFLIVDEPGGALRDVVEAEGEEDEEDAGDEAEPVPGEGAAHDVAADNAQGCHHLVKVKVRFQAIT